MKKDPRINKLFDDYADKLRPATDPTAKARRQSNAQKPPKRWRNYTAMFASVCCCMLIVIVILVSSPVFMQQTVDPPPSSGGPSAGSGPTEGDHEAGGPPSSAVSYYALEGLERRVVDPSDAELVDVAALGELFEITNADCTAYYANGKLRFEQLNLTVVDGGIVTNLSIIAEVNGFVRQDLAERYEKGADFSSAEQQDGFVAQAFVVGASAHFYLDGQSAAPCDCVERLVQLLG